MRKALAVTLSVLVAGCGLVLAAIAVMSGRLGAERYRAIVLYTLGGVCLLLFALAVLMPLFAQRDYRKVLRVLLFLAGQGVLLLFIFFGFMWMLVSDHAVGVMLAVFLSLYGIALLMLAALNLLLSDRGYRVFMYSLFREVPYVYYRLRT